MEATKVIHEKTVTKTTCSKVLVPKLRFKEFKGNWEIKKLGPLVQIKSGYTPSNYEFQDKGKYPFIKVEELNNSEKYQKTSRFYTDAEENVIKKNAVIFPKRGAAILNNKVRISAVDLLMDTNLMAVSPITENLNHEFLYYKIFIEKLYKIADCSTIPQINNKHIEPYKLPLPEKEEQQKIAFFLSAVDEKIQLLNRKKQLLEQYKKGVMQQLFSGKLRFKDEKGKAYPKWEMIGGDKLFDSISDKKHNSDLPILAITQDQGAVPREMINYQMTVTDSSIANYKVVQVGDFIISLRSFQGGIEYSNYKGICSPAYNILRPSSDKVNRGFYRYYLKTTHYIRQLQKNLEGIRDGKMISYKYFSEIKLPFPSEPEQKKIADFLSAIDIKIANLNTQITQTQIFKKGLLQQMFV